MINKRPPYTYAKVTRFHTGISNHLCGIDSAAILSSPDKATYQKQATNLQRYQNGSIFFYILLGVALFGALAFAISRGMRGQTSTTLNQRNINIAVSEILSEAQETETAISRLRQKGVSENDICFESNLFSEVNNSAYSLVSGCSQNTNKLYHRGGGNLAYRNASQSWLDKDHSNDQGYGEWMFTNINGVEGIGTDAMSTPDSMELIAFIPHIKKEICIEINSQLSIGSIIPDNGTAFTPEPVDSGFTSASGQINAAELQGKNSGCFKSNNTWDTYIFYQVLIGR